MKELRVLSLFSGCGGMDLGFEGHFEVLKKCINLKQNLDWIESEVSSEKYLLKKNNYKTVFANDINIYAKLAWLNYFSKFGYNDSIYLTDSIVDIITKSGTGNFEFPQNIDIVTGGFPCQDFSNAGKRNGFSSNKNHKGLLKTDPNEENRGNLYLWMIKTIETVKPKMFIAENVKGLSTLKDAKDIIIKHFSEASNNNYLILTPKLLLSADYGVSQKRERIIFIGFAKNALNKNALVELSKEYISLEYDPYPIKTHNSISNNLLNTVKSASNYLEPYVYTNNILKDLKEPDETDDNSQKYYSKARFLSNGSQGQIEIDLNNIAPTIRSEHHGNIEFRRLDLINGGKYIDEIKKGMKQRRLTVRECARIQTFPDDYQFIFQSPNGNLSASEAYKLIGNAVPPLLAYSIARKIYKNWLLYFKE
jgi:DNA (cytosine-5)-methyltransferase 1